MTVQTKKRKEVRQKYMDENKEEISQLKRNWYEKNKDTMRKERQKRIKMRNSKRNMQRKNKEKVNDYRTRYRNDPEKKTSIYLQRSERMQCPLCETRVMRMCLGNHIKTMHKKEFSLKTMQVTDL